MNKYQAPPTYVGLMVNHFQANGSPPAAAVVTAVANETVGLSIIRPGFGTFDPIDGVRHKDDPNKFAIEASGAGVWDYCRGPNNEDTLVRLCGLELAVASLTQGQAKRKAV
jgi:hypothetical protein